MTRLANLYGPPGTGKTWRLNEIAQAVVAERGPSALGAVTFTRAAASELKRRLAGRPLTEAQQDLQFPHVGTIHALCYRALGRPPVLRPSERTEWARSEGDALASFGGEDRPERRDTWDTQEFRAQSPCTRVLADYVSARQRMRPPAEADERLIRSYEDYKRQIGRMDFEDLLEAGAHEPLGVEWLLVDEAQDNSALLWSVIDAWSREIPHVVCAGDPWQAIFQFSGGDPRLFRSRPGAWTTIGDSYRLDADSADYARRILRAGGHDDDPLIDTWEGRGAGPRGDGSHFWLARTNALVSQIAQRLQAEATPYADLNGWGPLTSGKASAYRALAELRDEGSCSGRQLEQIAQMMPASSIGRAEKARVRALGRSDPDRRFDPSELGWDLDRALQTLPSGRYFSRVAAKWGRLALVAPPRIRIGTIHAAKGREADHVTLVRAWGQLPFERALVRDGTEACVAYVAATRHRGTLDFDDTFSAGGVYPFPRAEVVKVS